MCVVVRAAIVRNWGETFNIEECPVPQPTAGEALLKVRAGGGGLTLLNMRSGRFGGTTPRIMGHEIGGDIVAVGDGVTNVKVGDRATVYFYLVCGQCRWCRRGRETLVKILPAMLECTVMAASRNTFPYLVKIT